MIPSPENYITVLTPAKYDYQCLPEVPVSRKSYVAFSIRASADAHIALSSVYGDTREGTYEVTIGAERNSRSTIRDGGLGTIMEWTVTRNILDPTEFHSFWISWDGGVVALGRGSKKGEKCLVSWNVPSQKQHSVNCISVSTDEGSSGEWQFIEYIGENHSSRHDAIP